MRVLAASTVNFGEEALPRLMGILRGVGCVGAGRRLVLQCRFEKSVGALTISRGICIRTGDLLDGGAVTTWSGESIRLQKERGKVRIVIRLGDHEETRMRTSTEAVRQ